MSVQTSKIGILNPIMSFLSIIIIGIVISQYLVKDESSELPIIIGSIVLALLVAIIELRVMVRSYKTAPTIVMSKPLTEEERKDRLARFVAELFKEDIPFEEVDQQNKSNTSDNDLNDSSDNGY
ncbi:MAG: hypothetical protein OEY49_07735 [Candidatus Heimdallarchaeota archaeon]|nr:hypothetical protein [Candidatus Heimdallarchaeota archaeon]